MGLDDYIYSKTADTTPLNSANLSGFPAFVRLQGGGDTTGTGPGGLDSDAAINGKEDIEFFDENDNPVEYYWVTFDTANQVYEAWVLSDIVRDGTTQLKVGYGSGNTDNSSSEAALFDNVGDYALEDRYSLQDVGDGTAEDSTSNNRDGTVNGATESSISQFGSTSADFDNEDDVKLPGSVPGAENGAFYFSAWVHLDSNGLSSSRDNFFAKENNLLFATEGGQGLFIRTYGSNNSGSGYSITTGEWHHIVLWYDSSNDISKIYVDGSLVDEETDVGEASTPSNPTFLGGRDGDNNGVSDKEYMDGRMQEARFGSSLPSEHHIQTSYDMSPKAGYGLFSWNRSKPTTDLTDWDAKISASVDTLSDSSSFSNLQKVQPIRISQQQGFDIGDAAFKQRFFIGDKAESPQGLAFNNDGTKFFVTTTFDANIYEYDLGTAFDVSTASFSQKTNVSNQQYPEGITFNEDGTRMFLTGRNDKVSEYNLSTAFDIGTASFSQDFDVSSEASYPNGITFNEDGTKMFIVSDGEEVFQYGLGTGFDVSTASLTKSRDISSQGTGSQGLAFNNDGTKFFVSDSGNDDVYEYDMSTAFDIGTASFSQKLDIDSQRGRARNLQFNNDGSKMFVLGSGTSIEDDDINEYELGLSSNTGAGDAEFSPSTWDNINDATDLVVMTGNEEKTRSYEIESLDTQNRVAWLWVYGSWDSDGTTQLVIGAGGGDGTDYSVAGTGSNPWAETGIDASSHYNFDEASGTTIDSTQNNRDSTSTTGTTFDVSGQHNGARDFDGSDDFIEFEAANNYFDTDIALEFWFNSTQSGFSNQIGIISEFDDTKPDFYVGLGSVNNVGEIIWFFRDSTNTDYIVTDSTFNDGAWHHVYVEKTGSGASNMEIYVDGQNVATTAVNDAGSSLTYDSGKLEIGRRQSGDEYDGKVDSVSTFNSVKSLNWSLAEFDASPKAGQTFFDVDAATAANTKDTAAKTTYSFNPNQTDDSTTLRETAAKTGFVYTSNSSTDTGIGDDSASKTSFAFTPEVSEDTGLGYDQVTKTQLVFTPRTSTDTGTGLEKVSKTETTFTSTTTEDTGLAEDSASKTLFAFNPSKLSETVELNISLELDGTVRSPINLDSEVK